MYIFILILIDVVITITFIGLTNLLVSDRNIFRYSLNYSYTIRKRKL